MKFTYPPMATRPWFEKTASEAKRQTSRVHIANNPVRRNLFGTVFNVYNSVSINPLETELNVGLFSLNARCMKADKYCTALELFQIAFHVETGWRANKGRKPLLVLCLC